MSTISDSPLWRPIPLPWTTLTDLWAVSNNRMPVAFLRSLAFLVIHLTSFCDVFSSTKRDVQQSRLWHDWSQGPKRPDRCYWVQFNSGATFHKAILAAISDSYYHGAIRNASDQRQQICNGHNNLMSKSQGIEDRIFRNSSYCAIVEHLLSSTLNTKKIFGQVLWLSV